MLFGIDFYTKLYKLFLIGFCVVSFIVGFVAGALIF